MNCLKLAVRLTPALVLALLAIVATSPGPIHRAGSEQPTGSNAAPSVQAGLAAYAAEAVSIDRGARDYRALDQVDWQKRSGSTSQTAVVFGDPSKPGMYVQLLKRGPDDWSQPHAHPKDRYITVISGTMLIGTGAKFDKKQTVAIGPGGMIHDLAGQMHYDGTGPDGLIIEIIGMGPTARIEASGN